MTNNILKSTSKALISGYIIAKTQRFIPYYTIGNCVLRGFKDAKTPVLYVPAFAFTVYTLMFLA
jgi:hypothetical protein